MTFPIAVGTGPRHSSSRPFPRAISRELAHERDSSDGGEVNDHAVIMAMGTNVDETLTATMFISYHFITSASGAVDSASKIVNQEDIDSRGERAGADENILPSNYKMGGDNVTENLSNVESIDTEFHVIAELRVEITPTTSPFVSNMDAMSSRETKSRVPLGTMKKRRTPRESCATYAPNASIEFSSNDTHLACLIPLPIGHELVLSSEHGSGAVILTSLDNNYLPISTIVIFQIQTNVISSQQHLQQGKNLHLPALPDYIVESAIGGGKSENELENDSIKMVDNVDTSEMSSRPTFPGSTSNVASSRGGTLSYVAHRPKIVRALRSDLGKTDVAITSRLFVRKLSRGKSDADLIQSPTLKCATCMCNVPSDHFRGKSSSASSLLLVGTIDGRLLIVDFSLARVCSVALESVNGNTVGDCETGEIHYQKLNSSHTEEQNHQIGNIIVDRPVARRYGCSCNPIIQISQIAPTQWKPLDIYGNEQGSQSKGRVSTVFRDGSVNIYTTSFVVPSVFHVDSLSEDGLQNGNVLSNNSSDRIRGESNSWMNHTRLKMRLHLLATYHASKFDGDASVSRLRYIRSKWISPVVLSLLTRSSYLDNDFLLGQSLSKSVMQSEIEVAQIWCIAEVNQEEIIWPDVGWELSAAANILLASELKVPCGDSLNELVHDTFSLSRANLASPDCNRSKDSRLNFEKTQVFTECSRGMSLLYHRSTDCLAITSQILTCSSSSTGFYLRVRPFCLIWDWKRNVPGLTLAGCESYRLYQHDDGAEYSMHSLYSWFQLGDDEYNGLCALHVYERKGRAVKKMYSLSTLSPQNKCSTEGYLSVNEPSAVLLHGDSVSWPRIFQQTNTLDVSLKWEESRVPPTYVAFNGPCKIAAVGKDYGRSIAVAASRGLCVLALSRKPQIDSSRPNLASQSLRWKLFSNVNDEHRFRVVSMIWWECESDDFLLAVVQYAVGPLHLVCWSRKSIGFGSQLLKESVTKEEHCNDRDSGCGIALAEFRVHSMSIIRDPICSPHGARSTLSNRALLLLAYVSSDEGAGCCMNYTLYQLQTIPPHRNPELVFARKATYGSIPLQIGTSPDFSVTESINGIFLAGGSFLFDLEKDVGDLAPHNVIGVIGIITLFQGLVAVCVNQTEPILYRPSILGNAKGRNLIVSYWISCTISSRYGSRIAWNIIQNDGNVYCWSVPCTNAECLDRMGPDEHCSDVLPGLEKHSILGEICCLGSSTFWMNGATTNEREIALGPFCPLFHASTLYAGQRSRMNSSTSDPAAMNSFHVTNCIVAPPPFTPFLFVSFLILSSRSSSSESNPDSLTSTSNHELAIKSIRSTMRQQLHGLGSTSSALRLITLKVVELLDESKTVSNICVSSETSDHISKDKLLLLQKWKLGKAILSEVVTAVNEFYDALGFATFFLSVGRQLEPHQFDLIFPLPAILLSPNSPYLHTAEDLFSLSCECGSLATALSALPLFSSHQESVHMVNKLIYHCLVKMEENFQSCSSLTAITSYEEETYLHQLFWFGVKLEDAIEIEKSNEADIEEDGSGSKSESTEEELPIDSSQSSEVSSSTLDDDDTLDTCSSEGSHNVSFFSPCRSPHRKSRSGIVKRVVQRLFPSSGSSVIPDSPNEYAVKEAASSFILTDFNDSPIESLSVQHNNHVTPKLKPINVKASSSKENSPYDVFPSVAGSVCLYIGHTIFDETENENDSNYGWKALSAVAYLLQGDRKSSEITSASTENAKRISRMLTIKEFLSLAATSVRVTETEDSSIFVAAMMVDLTYRCRRQIHISAVGTVFNLILLLLLRYEACHDVRLSRANLITIGVVCGHLSGRICELLDVSVSCDVNDIYSVYADLAPLDVSTHSGCA